VLRGWIVTLLPRRHFDADIAIIGSGFSGTLAALALQRRGRRVVIVERGRHPRFAIGESTTPLTNLLLEELADRYDMPEVRPLSKWGTWQRARPDIACGLKRGFTFLFHEPGRAFDDGPDHRRQLMVAASPHDEIADTHWYRPDFDLALLEYAQQAGAIYLDQTTLQSMDERPSSVRLKGVRDGHAIEIDAGFVIDASGPRGFLATRRATELPPRWLPPTQGVYTHFEDVSLWEHVAPPAGTPPYPMDAAALHHVFPGGWIWVLRFNNGLTSAGAALTDALANEVRAQEGAAGWQRLLGMFPSIGAQFSDARPSRPFIYSSRVAFRCREVVGERWALLPSAAGVIDPLLSTGFPLTLLGLSRLLTALETAPGDERREALAGYAAVTQTDLDVTEQLVAALYATMNDPELFKRLTLLYFAAASFSETVRRLGRPKLAPDFLLHGHPTFGVDLRRLCARVLTSADGRGRTELFNNIDRAVEPFDAAGLLDRSRRDWYPVLASDLIGGRRKLQATEAEIDGLLERCGLRGAGS